MDPGVGELGAGPLIASDDASAPDVTCLDSPDLGLFALSRTLLTGSAVVAFDYGVPLLAVLLITTLLQTVDDTVETANEAPDTPAFRPDLNEPGTDSFSESDDASNTVLTCLDFPDVGLFALSRTLLTASAVVAFDYGVPLTSVLLITALLQIVDDPVKPAEEAHGTPAFRPEHVEPDPANLAVPYDINPRTWRAMPNSARHVWIKTKRGRNHGSFPLAPPPDTPKQREASARVRAARDIEKPPPQPTVVDPTPPPVTRPHRWIQVWDGDYVVDLQRVWLGLRQPV